MQLIDGNEIRARMNNPTPLVTGMIDPSVQIQPNGVDFTVRDVFALPDAGFASIDFDNTRRRLPKLASLARAKSTNDCWMLEQGAYVIGYNETVNLPNDVFAIMRTRSTLLRSGMSVETALWDSGYCGRGQSLLVVHSRRMLVELYVNARVVQMVLFQLGRPIDNPYHGIYQGEGGS